MLTMAIRPGFIGAVTAEKWAEMKQGSVPESLRANAELIRHAHEQLRLADPIASVEEYDRRARSRQGVPVGSHGDWDAVDFERMRGEYAFSWNWCKAGSPTFMLTHNTAALLSTTRAPLVDFEHAPYPAFLVGVPHEFLPLTSDVVQATRWIGVQSGRQMGLEGGIVMTIPDSDTLANAVGVGRDGALSEESVKSDSPWAHALRIAVRLTANVIQ